MPLPIQGNFSFFTPATEGREVSLFRYKAGTHLIDYTQKATESWPNALTVYGDMPFYSTSAIDNYGAQTDYDELGINIWKKDPSKATEVVHPASASFPGTKKRYGYGVFGSYLLAKRNRGTGSKLLYLSVRNENYLDLSYQSRTATYSRAHPKVPTRVYECTDVTFTITKYSKALAVPGRYTDADYANASVSLTIFDPSISSDLKVPEIDNAIGKGEDGVYRNGRPRFLDPMPTDTIKERFAEIISKTADEIVVRVFLGPVGEPTLYMSAALTPDIIGLGILSTAFKVMFLGHMKYIETISGNETSSTTIFRSVNDSGGLMGNANKASQALRRRDSLHPPKSLGVPSHVYLHCYEKDVFAADPEFFEPGNAQLYQDVFNEPMMNLKCPNTTVSYGGRTRYITIPFAGADDDPVTGTLGDDDCYLICVQAKRIMESQNDYIFGGRKSPLANGVNDETFKFDSGYQILAREGS